MRYLSLVIVFMILFAVDSIPQHFRQKNPEAHQKIEELKKLKLIEALDMDEETTLRFFARRNEHQEKMQNLYQSSRDITEKIENELKSETSSETMKNLVNEYLSFEEKIMEERISFINSLTDILSSKQKCKLIVFEKKFNEEIKNIIFKERMKDKRN